MFKNIPYKVKLIFCGVPMVVTSVFGFQGCKKDPETGKEPPKPPVGQCDEVKKDLATAKTNLDAAKTKLATAKGNLEAAETKLANAETKLATAQTNLEAAKIKLEAAIADSTGAAKELIQYDEEALQNNGYKFAFNNCCEESGFSSETKILSERATAHRLAIAGFLERYPGCPIEELLLKLDKACEKYLVECTKPNPQREAVEQYKKEIEQYEKEIEQCGKEVEQCKKEVEQYKKEVEQCEKEVEQCEKEVEQCEAENPTKIAAVNTPKNRSGFAYKSTVGDLNSSNGPGKNVVAHYSRNVKTFTGRA